MELSFGPMETICIAENAPLCQMVVQNDGPAVVEVRCEDGDPVVLMQGKLALMSAYGRITVESVEENWAIVEMEFMPRTRRSLVKIGSSLASGRGRSTAPVPVF